jgi:hypothetical protein
MERVTRFVDEQALAEAGSAATTAPFALMR